MWNVTVYIRACSLCHQNSDVWQSKCDKNTKCKFQVSKATSNSKVQHCQLKLSKVQRFSTSVQLKVSKVQRLSQLNVSKVQRSCQLNCSKVQRLCQLNVSKVQRSYFLALVIYFNKYSVVQLCNNKNSAAHGVPIVIYAHFTAVLIDDHYLC